MAGWHSAAEQIMGSFIITLKTINKAGIYTRSQDLYQEPGSSLGAGIQPSSFSTGTPQGTS